MSESERKANIESSSSTQTSNSLSYNSCGTYFAQLPFLKLFKGFSLAIRWESMVLAVCAVVLTFLAGWILQGFAPRAVVSTVNVAPYSASVPLQTELDFYINSNRQGRQYNAFIAKRNDIQQTNRDKLRQGLIAPPMNLPADKADKLIRKGTALDAVSKQYDKQLDVTLNILAHYYERDYKDLQAQYEAAIEIAGDKDAAKQQLKQSVAQIKAIYTNLFNAVCNIKTNQRANPDISGLSSLSGWVDSFIKSSPQLPENRRAADRKHVNNDRKTVLETIQLARVLSAAQALQGQGIFSTFAYAKLKHAHNAVLALIFHGNFKLAGREFCNSLLATCWLVRFHPIFSVIFFLTVLLIWSIFGGAICRISALNIARQECISPGEALKFSMSRLGSFFAAPLIPLIIILVIMLLIWIDGLVAAIPGIGEIIAGLLFPITIIGGVVMTLMIIGLTGGLNLMFPTIAVEGSESFDAISRSFSYIYGRPWRMAFYTFVSVVYGSICYLFVRFFVFLILFTIHLCLGGAMNIDGSSYISVRGKLDAMWQMPSFSHIFTPFSQVGWSGLGFTEMLGAFCIWIWVTLMAAVVLGFVATYFFSFNTIIYLLLRNKVDATDIEDVYVEHDMEDLLAEETTETELETEVITTPISTPESTPEPKSDVATDNTIPLEPADTTSADQQGKTEAPSEKPDASEGSTDTSNEDASDTDTDNPDQPKS